MERLNKIDTLRGLNLINMAAYHAMWDIVYLFNVNIPWYKGIPGYIWQQVTCQIFIILSGFSWNLGKHHVKRGITVFLCGALVTLVTLIFMPEERVMFGILTFMGSAMLIMIPVDRLIRPGSGKIRSGILFFTALSLFTVTRHVGSGYLGFTGLGPIPEPHPLLSVKMPPAVYKDQLTAYLGFPYPGFFSDDYFPLIPWIFLYMAGYSLYHMLPLQRIKPALREGIFSPLEFIGRHTLMIYLIHQPLILGSLYLVNFLFVKLLYLFQG